ncbi:MAG: hypothetical protein HC936_16715 [Leptolyngbyaceae cyanobacterium SU_3_3]|nr:hypothetical protein [Leptolyngbyaceae cyanobacterium SU_3_3]
MSSGAGEAIDERFLNSPTCKGLAFSEMGLVWERRSLSKVRHFSQQGTFVQTSGSLGSDGLML